MRRIALGILFLLGLGALTGCATTPPSDVLAAMDACDRQAELCRRYGADDPIYDEYGRRLGCDTQADRCFNRVYRDMQRRYGYSIADDFIFYGRSGYWSPRRGWAFGSHGRPYTYYRDRDYNRYGRDPYYDPYGYDDPYDCFGRRRASWCYDRDGRDRDRDRDNDRGKGRDGDRDRDGDRNRDRDGDRDDNRRPPSTRPSQPPVDGPNYDPSPTRPPRPRRDDDGRQPSRSSPPSRTTPPPSSTPPQRSTPPSSPPPQRSTPAPRPSKPPAPKSKPSSPKNSDKKFENER